MMYLHMPLPCSRTLRTTLVLLYNHHCLRGIRTVSKKLQELRWQAAALILMRGISSHVRAFGCSFFYVGDKVFIVSWTSI